MDGFIVSLGCIQHRTDFSIETPFSFFPVAMENSTAQAVVAHSITYSPLQNLWASAIALDLQATLMLGA